VSATTKKCEPWIGHATDGARTIIDIVCPDGEVRFVTVHEIVSKCEMHATVASAIAERPAPAQETKPEIKP
jgi:hypothetical protein